MPKKMCFNIMAIFLSAVLLCGCSHNKQNEKLEAVLKENHYTIVDVRTEEEYQSGHVVGAINIPYDEIDEQVKLDQSRTILVYCRSGNRSKIAYQTLQNLGYDVIDLGAYQTISLEKEN